MDVYGELGIVPLINAAGTLTDVGGSLMLPQVVAAMAAASRSFVDMHELHLAAGRRIADLLTVESAHVCSGAAAGITLMAAACMAGADPERISQLPDTAGRAHNFVVQRAHRNPFDQAVRLAGGQFVEVDADPIALTRALTDKVAAVYYTLAWFCTGEALPLPEVAAIAHEANVPVIVDAAAEIPPQENLTRFISEGADLVVFSGGKALRGPQASGVILGRRDLVEACRLNDSPHMGVGRPMKAGKEEIVGLVRAVELYVAKDYSTEHAVWERRVAHILGVLSEIERVRAWRQLPYGIGQQIPHAAVTWDEKAVRLTHEGLVDALRNGSPRIAVQLISPEDPEYLHLSVSEVRIHPHTLREGEEIVVARRLKEALGAGR